MSKKTSTITLAIALLIAILFTFTSTLESAVSYLQKNQQETTSFAAQVAVLEVTNPGTNPADRGAAVKAFNLGGGSGPGFAFGQFGGTNATSNAAGFNGWAASTGLGNAIGVKGSTDTHNGVGVYGEASSMSLHYGLGVYGFTRASGGRGILGYNTRNTNPASYGVEGSSGFGGVRGYGDVRGIYGSITPGSVGYGLYTPNNVMIGGHCTGCSNNNILALNESSSNLFVGQPVVLSGLTTIDNTFFGQPPELLLSSPIKVDLLTIDVINQGDMRLVVGIIQGGATLDIGEFQNPACDFIRYQSYPMATPQAPHGNTNLETLRAEYDTATKECSETPAIYEVQVYPHENAVPSGGVALVATSGIAQIKLEGLALQGQLVVLHSNLKVTAVSSTEVNGQFVIGYVAGETNEDTGLTPIYLQLK